MSLDILWMMIPPLVIVLSITFHVSRYIGLNKSRRSRKHNLSLFFSWLAAMDLIVLFTSITSEWLRRVLRIDVRATTTGMCRFHRWLTGLAMDIPPWILVVSTYEKRAFLWCPVPADSQFSRYKAKSVILGLVLVFAIRHADVGLYEVIVVRGRGGSSNRTSDSESEERSVCSMAEMASSVFLEIFFPWLDLMLRLLSPFVCLGTYSVLIVRKLRRERHCADQLMEKIGIAPPDWLPVGLQEAERTVIRTATLTVAIFICGLPYSLYYVVRALDVNSRDTQNADVPEYYHDGWRLTGIIMLSVSYGWLYVVFIVEDYRLLLCIRDTWRHPASRKRGTPYASRPPQFYSDNGIQPLGLTCFLDFIFFRNPKPVRRHTQILETPENVTVRVRKDSGTRVPNRRGFPPTELS